MAITASETFYVVGPYLYRNGQSISQKVRNEQRQKIKDAGYNLKTRHKTMAKAEEAARVIREFTGIECEASACFMLGF